MSFPPEAADKLLAVTGEAGVAAEAVFAAAGMSEGTPLDYPALCALYEAAAGLTGDEAFGLEVGLRTRPDMYGLLGYAARHSATLGEALERLIALQRVWTDAVALELDVGPRAVRLRYGPRVPVPPSDRRQECEQMMAAIATFVASACGARPLEVRFEHGAPDNPEKHRTLFGSAVSFGAAATEMELPSDALALPLADSDPKLGALIGAQAERTLADQRADEPLLEAVRAAVRDSLDRGRAPSLAVAAAAIGLGPRTLQRRLRERQVGWRALIEEVRIGLAKELLADPRRGLSQIAFLAGFSQASAFHRAFRRIVGTTPRSYRLGLAARIDVSALQRPSRKKVVTG